MEKTNMTNEEYQETGRDLVKDCPWFVVMRDQFMSGWGRADGLVNWMVVGCHSLEQAEAIELAAKDRDEMQHVSITDIVRHRSRRLYTYKQFGELSGNWLDHYAGCHHEKQGYLGGRELSDKADLSHWWCPECGEHWFMGRHWTKKEWEEYRG